MQYTRIKHFTKRIDECDAVSAALESSTVHSKDMLRCLQGAIIQRRHNLIQLMRQEGVNIDEVV